jgi:hypothetical protein
VSDDGARDPEADQPVGTLAEEATKLLLALQGWAKESGSDYAGAAADAATHVHAAASGINEHIATGGEDCRYCPVCQVISAVRGTSPEVKEHLSAAATSVLAAVSGLMETRLPDRSRRAPEEPLEKIDLSDDDWGDD